MQVEDVDGRDRVVRQDEVGFDPDDPAIDRGLRNLAAAQLDDVLARPDVDRPVLEVEGLGDANRPRLRRAREREARSAETEGKRNR